MIAFVGQVFLNMSPTDAMPKSSQIGITPARSWQQELRQADEQFYITLALRNFNRGPPLLPSDGHHDPIAVYWKVGA